MFRPCSRGMETPLLLALGKYSPHSLRRPYPLQPEPGLRVSEGLARAFVDAALRYLRRTAKGKSMVWLKTRARPGIRSFAGPSTDEVRIHFRMRWDDRPRPRVA